MCGALQSYVSVQEDQNEFSTAPNAFQFKSMGRTSLEPAQSVNTRSKMNFLLHVFMNLVLDSVPPPNAFQEGPRGYGANYKLAQSQAVLL